MGNLTASADSIRAQSHGSYLANKFGITPPMGRGRGRRLPTSEPTNTTPGLMRSGSHPQQTTLTGLDDHEETHNRPNATAPSEQEADEPTVNKPSTRPRTTTREMNPMIQTNPPAVAETSGNNTTTPVVNQVITAKALI